MLQQTEDRSQVIMKNNGYNKFPFTIESNNKNKINCQLHSVNVNSILQLLDFTNRRFPWLTKFIGFGSKRNDASKWQHIYLEEQRIYNSNIIGAIRQQSLQWQGGQYKNLRLKYPNIANN